MVFAIAVAEARFELLHLSYDGTVDLLRIDEGPAQIRSDLTIPPVAYRTIPELAGHLSLYVTSCFISIGCCS